MEIKREFMYNVLMSREVKKTDAFFREEELRDLLARWIDVTPASLIRRAFRDRNLSSTISIGERNEEKREEKLDTGGQWKVVFRKFG